jgi:hypothetical protein
MHITIIVKKTSWKKRKRKKRTSQTGTIVRAPGFNIGLLGRSQFAFGRSYYRPTRSRFCVVTLTISPYTNVTLTFDWITLFMGDMGQGALHREERK